MKLGCRLISALSFLILVELISLSRSAEAAGSWYVATTGDDSHDCQTISTPCATINGAIGKANSGDTIYVATGVYTSSTGNEVVLLTKSLTLSGGWDLNFSSQSGMSTIDARHTGRGMTVNSRGSSDPIIVVNVERFVLENGWLRGSPLDIGGGGILNQGTLNLDHCSIRNNGNQGCSLDDNCHGGGGILNQGTLNLNHSVVSANLVNVGFGLGGIMDGGGGIMNTGLLDINDSAIDSNTSGGINNTGQLTITNSTITRNNGTYGGGLSNSGSLVINNSTIGANRAGQGGGIRNYGTASVTIRSSTISGNSAFFSGGGITNGDGVNPTNVTLQNTILAKNSSASGDPDCEYIYPVGSMGYNLLGSSACGPITATDIVNLDPLLGPLTDLPGYYPLLFGSPALNAGNPGGCTDNLGNLLAADQRGLPRFGRCDIGAYEVQPLTYSDIAASQPVYPGSPITYTIVLTNGGPSQIDNVMVTDTPPGSLVYSGLLTASSGNVIYNGSAINWQGTVDAGDRVTITLGATIAQTAPIGVPIANSAVISGGNDIFTRTVSVIPVQPLTSTLSVDHAIAYRGLPLTYTITLTNSSPVDISSVTISDTLPALLLYDNLLTASSDTPTYGDGEIDWIGPVHAGETVKISFGATVSQLAPVSVPITTTANILSDGEAITRSVGVTPQDPIVVVKSVNQPSAFPGTSLTYTLTLTNSSYSDFTQIVVTDTLPNVLSYNGYLSASSGNANYSDGSINWFGPVNAGEFVTLTYGTTLSQTAPVGIPITNSATINSGIDIFTRTATINVIPIQRLVFLPLCLSGWPCGNFFDDFSNPASGWPVGEDSNVRIEYLNGEYRILNKNGGYLFRAPTCPRQNYSVEADARWGGTTGYSYGLIFGVTGGFSQYYLFEINADNQGFDLYRTDASGDTQLVPPTYSSAIHSGTASNHLKVTRNGSQIILEVNGRVLGTWTDGTITGLTSSGLASWAYSDVPNADARFDNFRVTSLAGSGNVATQTMNSQNAEPGNSQTTPLDRMPKLNRRPNWLNISESQP
jgi:uncharacterized repeat protein (TIGR01451 family)